MSKLKVSSTLSEDAIKLLKKIAEVKDRSGASTVEQLIKEEAKRLKIK